MRVSTNSGIRINALNTSGGAVDGAPAGKTENGPLRLDFDRRLMREFHGSRVTSDAGLLAYRELEDALGLTHMVGDDLFDPRTGKNGQHAMKGLFRQSVFGRLGGYENVNDADRLGRDPAMRWIVGGRAVAEGCGIDQSDGALRDRVPCHRREPHRACWFVRTLDRPRACAASAEDDRPRHGLECEPDPR